MEDDGDVLSETPNGGNEVEDKSTKENGAGKKQGDEKRGKVGLRVLTLGPNFPPSLQHQLLQRGLINNRKFRVEMGHKNMEALRKLQKNQSESLPVHSEAKVLPYTAVNTEKLIEDSRWINEFAEGCRPGGHGRNNAWSVWVLATFFMCGVEVELGL